MVEMFIEYQNDLHCLSTHGPSRSTIETDAPVDNQGRGERFSSTDLLGAALGSCVLTTMAIWAKKEGHRVELNGAKARVTKEMIGPPRRIGRLSVEVTLPSGIPRDLRARLEAAGKHCPVHKSLSSEIDAPITFAYPD